MDSSDKKSAAVYVAWATFKNAVMDSLSQSMPNVIDKTVFTGQSGGVQSQIMAGLKFLELIDEKGKPTKALVELTDPDEAARKRALAKLMKDRYAAVFAIGVDKATPKQLIDTMTSAYDMGGDTLDKAIRFFISAAKYADIPLSALLDKKGSTPRRRGTRKASATNGGVPNEQSAGQPPPGGATTTTTGNSRTIKLKGGGTVTVTVSVDVLKLKGDDRAFVFRLSDALDAYEDTSEMAGESDAA